MSGHVKLIRSFASSLKSKGKKPATVESYQRDAIDFLSYLDRSNIHLDMVDTESLEGFTQYLQDRDRHNSIRRKIIGIRQFFRFIADETREYDSPLDYFPIPNRDESLPPELEEDDIDEIVDILQTLSATLKAKRDLAIFSLLSFEGLKASELIGLRWQNIILSSHQGSIQIFGTKSRTIDLGTESLTAMRDYKEHVFKTAHIPKDYIFISFKGRETLTVTPQISRHGLKFLIYELGEISGIKHLNTELLRHYAIKHQLALGKSPSEVMAHFGLRRLGNIAKHVNRRNSTINSGQAPNDQ